ncbi:MAG TPA: hypothetical protein VLU95_03885, partial [Candidatus Acidoferrum sp.]|nr:hypothetical protein [Candidatus Acidoferrum sp.]
MRKKVYLIISILLIAIILVGIVTGLYFNSSTTTPSSTKLQVVAGENFWGSLISQLGGSHVQVLSIVTDPNADPHEYESNAANAQAI